MSRSIPRSIRAAGPENTPTTNRSRSRSRTSAGFTPRSNIRVIVPSSTRTSDQGSVVSGWRYEIYADQEARNRANQERCHGSSDRLNLSRYSHRDTELISGPAVGGENAGGGVLGQIEGAEIGAAAQHRFIGKLRYHRVGLGIDDLIDDRSRGLIEDHLMRYRNVHGIGIVARGSAGVRNRDALARRQLGRDRAIRRFAHGRSDRRGDRCSHRSDAEIRTHGSLLASLESNPNPSPIATMRFTSQRGVRECTEYRADAGAIV